MRRLLTTHFLLCVAVYMGCAGGSGQQERTVDVLRRQGISVDSLPLLIPDSLVLADLKSPAFSPNGQHMCLTDGVKGCALIFDAQAGRLEALLSPGLFLTDSLEFALIGDPDWYDKIVPHRQWNNPDGSPVALRDQEEALMGSYESATFLDDSTVLLGTTAMMVITLPMRAKSRSLYGHTCLVTAGLDGSVVDFTPVNIDYHNYFPQPGSIFQSGDGMFVLPSLTTEIDPKATADTIWTMSMVSGTGEILKDFVQMPGEHVSSGLRYDLLDVYVCRYNDDFIVGRSTMNYIEYLKSRDTVRISGVPGNDSMFAMAARLPGGAADTLMPQLQTLIKGLFHTAHDNLIVPWISKGKQAGTEDWNILEVTVKGRILRNIVVPRRSVGEVVKCVGYNPENNRINLFSVSGRGEWNCYSYDAL